MLLATMAVACSFSCSSCSRSEEPRLSFSSGTSQPQPDGTVRIDEASRPYVHTVDAKAATGSGVVRAPARVAFRDGAVSRVDALVGGRVVEVKVKIGSHVSAGDAVAVLSSPDAADARAQLASANAGLEEARREVARHQRMAAAGVDVPSEMQAAMTKLSESEAELGGIQAKTAFLGDGIGPTVTIKAPISGTVQSVGATAGTYVSPDGDPVLEIANPSATWIIADVFERDLPLVNQGARVSVDVPSLSRKLVGQVVNIGAAVEGNIRTAPVYVSLDADEPVLRSGMYARATIESGDVPGISIPSAAVLVKDGMRTVVYVQAATDTFQARDVKVGASIDGQVRVLEGVAMGDKVVVEGALLLDGAAEQLL
jgi:cobalt-zinc-cadmium efflux system membrane fusion protein